MVRRKIVAIVIAALAMFPTVGVSPANAILFVGACELRVNFTFTNGPIGPTTTLRNYTIDIAPAVPGQMPCQTTENGVDILRSTGVDFTSGSSSVWNCAATVAGGTWRQWWRNAAGQSTPPSTVGWHQVYGVWGAWTVPLQGLNPVNFLGAIELTLDPATAVQQTQACAEGRLTQLRTVGVQVFEDPKV